MHCTSALYNKISFLILELNDLDQSFKVTQGHRG